MAIASLLTAAAAVSGCGGSVEREGVADAATDAGRPSGPDASLGPDGPAACDTCDEPDFGPACAPGSPLDCLVNEACPGGGHTTITGTVYDPAGRNALSNVAVFVPEDRDTLPAIATGTSSCTTCVAPIGDYVTATLTNAMGYFRLLDVPTGKNIPLVVQTGKWRRAIVLPSVADCAETPVPDGQARLPRNHGEGDLPQMALLTGGCDNFACFLRGVGVDAAEFSSPHGGGRVDVYQGLGAGGVGPALSGATAGDCTTSGCPLWGSKQSLEAYDDVYLGCECAANEQTKRAAGLQAMHDWLDEGGEVIATHSQATWFRNGPPEFQSIAIWTDGPASGAPGPFEVNTSTSKGVQLAAWLASVSGGDNRGVVPLAPADVSTSVTTLRPAAIDLIDDRPPPGDAGGDPPGTSKAFSFATPISPFPDASTGQTYCGKAYITDIHAGGGKALTGAAGDASAAPAAVPGACDGGPLTAEEKALEFLLFDHGICVETMVHLPLPLPPPPPLPD